MLATVPWFSRLLLAEGHAVGALILGRIGLMGANQDLVQGAVICLVTVVSALGHSAGNALVHIGVHSVTSFVGFGFSIPYI